MSLVPINGQRKAKNMLSNKNNITAITSMNMNND